MGVEITNTRSTAETKEEATLEIIGRFTADGSDVAADGLIMLQMYSPNLVPLKLYPLLSK